MTLYTIVEAVIGLAAGVLIAVCTKKAEGVVYGKWDKAGIVLNILLIPVYVCLAPMCMFLGMISYPAYEGILGMLGWIVSILNASMVLFCGVGLGLSVAWRKKGKSKQSFLVQFAGLAGTVFTIGMYCLLAGNLLESLN